MLGGRREPALTKRLNRALSPRKKLCMIRYFEFDLQTRRMRLREVKLADTTWLVCGSAGMLNRGHASTRKDLRALSFLPCRNSLFHPSAKC